MVRFDLYFLGEGRKGEGGRKEGGREEEITYKGNLTTPPFPSSTLPTTTSATLSGVNLGAKNLKNGEVGSAMDEKRGEEAMKAGWTSNGLIDVV